MGESTYTGLPFFFVRLAGCNLRCSFCDTKYSYEEPDREMSVAEILNLALASRCAHVEITGGEPLLQEETPRLARELLHAGKTVLVETNGSLDISLLPEGVVRIVDVKCPGSGMSEHNLPENMDRLRANDEVKFVLTDRKDFEWARAFIVRHNLIAKCPVLLSPACGSLAPAQLAAWILESGLNVRLQIQLHKFLWPDRDRGV
jgi:7-carboxy-7-deazaguanine synthase